MTVILHVDIQFPQNHLKRLSFTPLCAVGDHVTKLVVRISLHFCLNSPFCFIGRCVCSFGSTILSCLMLPVLFCSSSQGDFGYLGSFVVPYKFEFFLLVRNVTGILIGIESAYHFE